jgi:Ca2+-binding RTX toxin-like protein
MVATTLRRGDIAIIGVDTEDNGTPNKDSISVILLAPVGSGTVFYITDRAWNGSVLAAASTGEGTLTYTAATDLPAGTVIHFTQAQLNAAGIQLADTGETLYVYQGTNANTPTTFLHAVDIADSAHIGGQLADGFDGNELLNTGLVDGISAVSIGTDNAKFGTRTWNINKEELFLQINNDTDWNNNNNSWQPAWNPTHPNTTAPDAVIYVAGSGASKAIVQLNVDGTYGGGTTAYAIQHALQFHPSLTHPSDITLDPMNDAFFFIDSDVNTNRLIQGKISDLLATPGGNIPLTVLYTAPTGVAGSMRTLSIDVVNKKVYFDAGTTFNRVNYDTANQAKVQLADLGTENYITQMSINYATGTVYLGNSVVDSVFGSDYITRNQVFVGAVNGTGTNAANSVTFTAINWGTQGDTAIGGEGSPLGNTHWPVERGSIRGIDVNEANGHLYIVTGTVILDNDGNGLTTYRGGVWTYNPSTGAVTNLYTQNGSTGPVGLLYYIDVDPVTGRYYVLDETGTNAAVDDSGVWTGLLGVAGTPTLVGYVGNNDGLGGQGLEIQHAPYFTGGSGLGGLAVTEASSAPASGESSRVLLFTNVVIEEPDLSGGNELRGALVRVSGNFVRETSTVAGHAAAQDILTINNAESGSIAGTSITFAYNRATGQMTLSGSGTVAQYKAALESVRFSTSGDNVTDYGTKGTRTVSASTFDGLLYSDEIHATVSVTGINDAPLNSVGSAMNFTEDTTGGAGAVGPPVVNPVNAVTGISIADVDADPASHVMSVTLAVNFGTLTIRTDVTGGLTSGQVAGNGTATLTLTGTQNAINATLAATTAAAQGSLPNGLVYTPPANFNGAALLTVTTSDNGGSGNDPGLTGTGTSEADSDPKTLNVADVNDAPVRSGDGTEDSPTILEDTPYTDQNAPTVASLFGGQFSDPTDVQFHAVNNPTGSTGDSFAGIAIVANGSNANGSWEYWNGAAWTAIGAASQSAAKTLSASTLIRFNPTLNYNGAAPTLTAHLIESGGPAITNGGTVNLSAGGAVGGTTVYSTGTVVLSQAITPVNDAPVNTLGSTVNTTEDATNVALTGMSIADVEATGDVSYTLTVLRGTLTLLTNVPGGITSADIAGNGTNAVTITATVAEINATLAAANGIRYTPNANVNGSDTLTAYLNDLGQSGQDPSSTTQFPLTVDGSTTEEDYDSRTITIAPVNDAPTVAGDGTEEMAAIAEDTPSLTGINVQTFLNGQFSDAADNQTANGGTGPNALAGIAVIANGSSVSTGQWQYREGMTWVDIGTASLSAAKIVRSTADLRFNPAPDFNGAAPTLTVHLFDSSAATPSSGTTVNLSGVGATGGSTMYSTGTVVISQSVTAVNDAPVIGNLQGDNVAFVEGSTPQYSDAHGNATVTDVDSADFDTGTLTVEITANGVASEDVLAPGTDADFTIDGTAVKFQGTTIATFTGGTNGDPLVFTFNANATPARVQTLLTLVNYDNTNEANPSAAARTLTWTLTDGDGGSTSRTSTMTVLAVNDAPEGGAANGASVVDDALLTFTAAHFSTDMTDAENHNFAAVKITTLPSSGTIFYDADGSGGAAPVAISAGASFTKQQIDDGKLTYAPVAGSPGTPTFTYQVQDDGGTANGGVDMDPTPNTFTITVTTSNAAPALDLNGAATGGTGTAAAYTEHDGPSLLAPDAELTDSNDTMVESATVWISAGFLAGDYLTLGGLPTGATGTGGAITFSYDTATGILTLTGSATLADYQAALRAVGYEHSGDAPGTSRTVSWKVNDGDADSNVATTAVTVTDLNDAPVNTVPGAQNGTEDTNLVFANSNAITVADADSGTLTVTLTVANGRLTLSGTTGLTFTTGDGTGDPTMTFSGTASAINAALSGMIYRGNLNFEGQDTLQIETSDGTVTDTDSVTITLADDGIIHGDGGDNVLTGTPQSDVFWVMQAGSETLSGLGSNDSFFIGAYLDATDSIDGGAGTNDQLALQGNYGTMGPSATPHLLGANNLVNVERLYLMSGSDVTTGESGTNSYDYHLKSVDANVAAGGTLTVYGGNLASDEGLIFDGSAETDGAFFLFGGASSDALTGGAGGDYLDGGAGADTLRGGLGNDVYVVDTMFDVVIENAGEGTDEVRTGLGDRNNYALMYILPAHVENLTGTSNGAQGVYANALNNIVTMGAGGDLIVMHHGGDDTVYAGGGNDFIHFGDAFTAADQVDGGAGDDTVGLLGSYNLTLAATSLTSVEKLAMYSAGDSSGATAYNYTVTTHNGNVASGQTLTVVAQSLLAHETLVFDGSAELDGSFNVRGGRGADTITGGAGADRIWGGLGADVLTGGGGNDIFEYQSAAESTAAARDTIVGFNQGDKINLVAIDADGNAANGNSAFTFIGAGAFTGQAGQLRAVQGQGNNWTVEADTNGDGTADLVIAVTTSDGDPITGIDFWM